jgi:hypothetical protein
MRRVAWLAALGLAALSVEGRAQLVPLTRCQAAFPCSEPYGLRPADAVANLPDARLGNTLVGGSINGAFKLHLAAPHASSDPAEDAARLYVRKNPLKPTPTPTPAPTAAPTAKPAASGTKDLELP